MLIEQWHGRITNSRIRTTNISQSDCGQIMQSSKTRAMRQLTGGMPSANIRFHLFGKDGDMGIGF
jgi:phage-related protein